MRYKFVVTFAALSFFAHAAQAAAPVSSAMVVSVSTYSVSTSNLTTSTFTWRTQPNSAFHPGENLQYVIKYGVVVAGYSNLSVPEVVFVNHRPTYHIVSAAHSGGMVSTLQSRR